MRPRVSGSGFLGSLSLFLFLTGCASTAPSSTARFDAAVASAEARCRCRMGVAARHLESGRAYEHNGNAEFESASVIKIAVLTEAMAGVRDGRIDLSERWDLTPENKADGSGTLLLLDPGLNPTWNDLTTLMIGPSDNTATNAWIGRLGVDAINARMAALGFTHIRLLGSIPWLSQKDEEPSPWKGFKLGILTPNEVADWMTRVARGELLDAETSKKVFEYLDKDPSRLRIARRFPSNDLWAGKTGSMAGVRNDSGILRTKKGRFVLVVFTDGSKADGFGADHPSVLAIADVSRAIVDAWSAELPDVVEKPE
ncbi:MAG TPA: serine hydrolase [Thermoanaerobaculia bacterium]|nr:serine hydrolase [Thermoanaerobaculia bacterium]